MTNLNKILITGGNGTVASYFDFGIKSTRLDFDITDINQVSEFIKKNKPETIIHLAAETDMAKCEADPAHAYFVNTVGTYNIAMSAKIFGAKMIYVSTDAVFPASEKAHNVGDVEHPESIYGHSKYLGELAVKGLSSDYIIARTSWIFGGGKDRDKKFVGKFIPQLDKSEVITVNDQFSSPTYAKDFVQMLKQLIMDGKTGTFHVVNLGTASRYDMAKVIVETLNKKPKIVPTSAKTYGLLSYQQASGGLVQDVNLRSWVESLKDYIESEWK